MCLAAVVFVCLLLAKIKTKQKTLQLTEDKSCVTQNAKTNKFITNLLQLIMFYIH